MSRVGGLGHMKAHAEVDRWMHITLNHHGPMTAAEKDRKEANLGQWRVDDVPEGQVGRHAVEKFEVTRDVRRYINMINRMSGWPERYIEEGPHTRLVVLKDDGDRDRCIMSDTHAEIGDHLDVIRRAKGNCLINGLGLGVLLNAIAAKPEVNHVTVVEYSSDVMALVADHYRKKFGDKITIVEADALKWRPPAGSRLGMVWHDIWNTIDPKNIDEMDRLEADYEPMCEWQGSWARDVAEALRLRALIGNRPAPIESKSPIYFA